MLRIVATALLSLLLLPGHSLRAAEPEGVMNFFCSGTAEANDTRRPVKKIGLIINIDERTVIVSGLSVVAHIDRVDDVNILFGMESTTPGDIGIMGGIDRITGDAWYLTFTKGKNKKLKRGEMFELVCKRTVTTASTRGGHRQAPRVAAVDTWAIGPVHHRQAAGIVAASLHPPMMTRIRA